MFDAPWPLLAIRKLAPWGLVLACLVGTVGCGSKGPVYIEDHQRYVRIDETLEGLRQAYVERKIEALHNLLLPSDAIDRLEREAMLDFDAFKHIGLDWTVERINVNGDEVDVYLHWQGQWRRELGDPPIRERGHGRMRFTGTQMVLLQGVEGNLPFGMSGRSVPQGPSGESSNASATRP